MMSNMIRNKLCVVRESSLGIRIESYSNQKSIKDPFTATNIGLKKDKHSRNKKKIEWEITKIKRTFLGPLNMGMFTMFL